MMHAFANKQFNERAYKLITGSSLYAYVSHYFFIILIAVFIIRPYKVTFVPALIIEIVLTNGIILISYIILNFIYEMVVPPKVAKKEEGTEEER